MMHPVKPHPDTPPLVVNIVTVLPINSDKCLAILILQFPLLHPLDNAINIPPAN